MVVTLHGHVILHVQRLVVQEHKHVDDHVLNQNLLMVERIVSVLLFNPKNAESNIVQVYNIEIFSWLLKF